MRGLVQLAIEETNTAFELSGIDTILRLSVERKNSWRSIQKFTCPKQPQALNHGLSAVNAAIGLLRSFGAIGWLDSKSKSKLPWQLFDADGIKIELADYIYCQL